MIDSHCHLDLYPDPVAVARGCLDAKLDLISVTTTPSAFIRTRELGGISIRTALGFHPEVVHERRNELSLFEKLLPLTRFVGEVGLDGSSNNADHRAIQESVFERVLTLSAAGGGKILSVHSRRAAAGVLDMLAAVPAAGTFVLHWFSGTPRQLDRAVERGCWFGVGPAMLKSAHGKELVKRMPQDRVLTESDGPFGTVNRRSLLPWEVDKALPYLGQIWQLPTEPVGYVLEQNFEALLNVHPIGTADNEFGEFGR